MEKNKKTNGDWICYECEHEWEEENPFVTWSNCPSCESEHIAHY